MNVIQASILNNYCAKHPEVLAVFVQSNNSLGVYYRNKNNKISHKFSSVKRSSELEAELVWISLQNFESNYKDLLKYFHPDTYKGKRKNYELSTCISLLSQIRRPVKTFKLRELCSLLDSLDRRPPHPVSDKTYNVPNLQELFSGQCWLSKCKKWVSSYGWSQENLYKSVSLQYI